jgi:hypothetical protein
VICSAPVCDSAQTGALVRFFLAKISSSGAALHYVSRPRKCHFSPTAFLIINDKGTRYVQTQSRYRRAARTRRPDRFYHSRFRQTL